MRGAEGSLSQQAVASSLERVAVCPDCGSEIYIVVEGSIGKVFETHPRLRELSRSEMVSVMGCRHPKVTRCRRCGTPLSNSICPLCDRR